jgi:hypothetical protein
MPYLGVANGSVDYFLSKPLCVLFQTHLSFGREFTEAVEMKQVGELLEEA